MEDFSQWEDVNIEPVKPDFGAQDLPKPSIETPEDFRDLYITWAERSGVMEIVQGREFRIIASDLDKLLNEEMFFGMYKGKKRFISRRVAEILKVEPNPYPDEIIEELNASLLRRQLEIAYIQGSTEFASSQQQALLGKLGYMPECFRKWAHEVIVEEGEHGIQMAYWLLMEDGSELARLLVEDLYARVANAPDPELQQPLREFNPPVLTLPEFAHYFAKQDLDGWSQLTQTKYNCSALYAGQMRFFLRQEGRHLSSGDQIIKGYILADRIPIRLHLKMEWKWEAIGYRLHGNPINSRGAELYYQFGIKYPLKPLEEGGTFTIPYPEDPTGFRTFEISPDMDKKNLNGLNLFVYREIFRRKNAYLTTLLTEKQRKEAKEFLAEVSRYAPESFRKNLLGEGRGVEEFVLPTAQITWRPPHLADRIHNDPWPFLRGYMTDIFGFPIPSEKEYWEYRKLVDLSREDQEEIREITRHKGWMVEVPVDSRFDVYKGGPIAPTKNDFVFFSFTAGKKKERFYMIYTLPQRLRKHREQKQPPQQEN